LVQRKAALVIDMGGWWTVFGLIKHLPPIFVFELAKSAELFEEDDDDEEVRLPDLCSEMNFFKVEFSLYREMMTNKNRRVRAILNLAFLMTDIFLIKSFLLRLANDLILFKLLRRMAI
jgi:hypothetical protein